MTISVSVSWGELIDKITILEIKAERMADAGKVANVQRELAALRAARDGAGRSLEAITAPTADLRSVNERLWDIENEIRACERNGDFGEKFVTLARAVYQTNDRRAALKRQINLALDSELIEEKEYDRQA